MAFIAMFTQRELLTFFDNVRKLFLFYSIDLPIVFKLVKLCFNKGLPLIWGGGGARKHDHLLLEGKRYLEITFREQGNC